jgi:hypothetical protein
LLDGAGVPIVPTPTNLLRTFTNLAAGFYQVRTDSGDCNAVSVIVEIKEPTIGLTFTVNQTNVVVMVKKR